MAILSGGDGGNVLIGTPGADTIYGHSIADTVPNGEAILATEVGSGFNSPVFASSAPGDPGRLYVIEKDTGRIMLLDPSTGAKSVFLDIPDSEFAAGGERGVLSLAFDPAYATNGRFFVYLTNADGNVEVRAYQRSAGNPDVADAGSFTTIITVAHPTFANHNGGTLAFGPDGYLYVSIGDGGGGGDPGENAQDTDKLLGKILRLDVSRDDFPADSSRNYAIPADNPFVGKAGADEIWAYGLRNPWRISFDSATGDLYIADVGQNTMEEIDFQAAGSAGGRNYGWDILEGTLPFEGVDGPGLVAPVFQYDHTLGQSVTGGLVYRGPAAGLKGSYIFADFVSGRIWTLRIENGQAVDVIERTDQVMSDSGPLSFVSSFGTDGNGELYVVSLGGQIFRLTPSATAGDGDDDISGGNGNDTLYGGVGDDTISGGAGNDRLDGGIGADHMAGGTGNDTYVVDTLADVVTESARQGTDTIETALGAFSLAARADVEALTYTGSSSFTAAGNALANVLTGGAGNDDLDGGAGADRLVGLGGNDTYHVDSARDKITEAPGGGIDTVLATVSYALPANVENLTFMGAGRLVTTGNVLDNTITGGAQGDALNGGAGNDTLVGAGGNDSMNGGAGQDVFVFAPGSGNDSIVGFDANPAGGQDVLDVSLFGIDADDFAARVGITDLGSHTLLTIDGAATVMLRGVNGVGANTITVDDFRFA